jgi:uncharacterized protein YodC (DUF2158 family)
MDWDILNKLQYGDEITIKKGGGRIVEGIFRGFCSCAWERSCRNGVNPHCKGFVKLDKGRMECIALSGKCLITHVNRNYFLSEDEFKI